MRDDKKKKKPSKITASDLIKGDANCRLKVNGKYFVVNVGQECTIDTERQIAYKSDGTLVNAYVTGDYEDLYLKTGGNTIEITPETMTMEIIPKGDSF